MTMMAVGRDDDDGRGKRWSSDYGRWKRWSSDDGCGKMELRRWPFDVRQATMLLVTTSCSICSRGASLPFRSTKSNTRSQIQAYVFDASVPKLLLDYVFSASSSHHRSFSASSSHHRSFSFSASSSLHRSFSDATDPSLPSSSAFSSLYYIYLVTSHRHHFHMSNLQEGMEGNPVAGTMKKFSRIIAFLSIPILMGIEKLLNLPDAVTSSSTGQPKPPSPIPFSFEQPKDQSVIGHEDPPMVNKEASGPQASRVENEEVNSVISDIPRDGPRRPTKNAVRDWAAIFRTASRVGQARRVPPEDKPAAVRDGTGRENPIDISMST
ncbi:unnamed protein product [Brassica napus]|uniref:(rape) hypothetical protein n=1 Tax=Brassica napus TaxID=3708 RepID=A0A816KNC0_BRANA|nr:unnamed protein product [Brassica napus]